MARFTRYSTLRLFCTLYSFPAKTMPTASLLADTFLVRQFSAGSLGRAKEVKEPLWKESMERVRNIGISAHIDSDKTALMGRIMYYTRRIHEIPEDEGKDGVGAKMASMESKGNRQITIQSIATYCTWNDHKVIYLNSSLEDRTNALLRLKINITDIPGHVDSAVEVERALHNLDGAVLVLCSVDGVQSQSISIDWQMRRFNVPRLAFINKLDCMGADPWTVLNQARSRLCHHSAAMQVPIGLEDDFKGVVDLVQQKAYYFHGANGENIVTEKVPVEMEAFVAEKRYELIEVVSEVDDKLAKGSAEDISSADLEEAVRRTTIARKFIPIFMGSVYKNKGVQPLLDGLISYLPSPVDVSNYALDQSMNEKVVLAGTPNEPLVALGFKLEEGQFGQLTYLSIYEGVIRRGDFLININSGKKIKVPRLVRMRADQTEEDIQEAYAGEIVAVYSCRGRRKMNPGGKYPHLYVKSP